MVRLRSGRFDWTVQVGHPLPLTESGVRRRAQEKAIRLTLEFLQKKNIAEAKQRSTSILGLDLNSGLGLKGASEQVEEPLVGEFHRGEQKLAGHEMETLLRPTDSTSITTELLGIRAYLLLTARYFAHTRSLGGTGRNPSHRRRM